MLRCVKGTEIFISEGSVTMPAEVAILGIRLDVEARLSRYANSLDGLSPYSYVECFNFSSLDRSQNIKLRFSQTLLRQTQK